MGKDTINIAFCFDNNYVLGYLVTMVSLFENNKGEEIRVYIITPGLPEESKEKFNKLAEIYKQTVIYKDMNDRMFDGLPINDLFGKGTYYRYTIPELCKESKVLQVDGDVLIRHNIRELYDTDVSDVAMGVVEDQCSDSIKQINRLRIATPIFNNGVQLMNLDYWRKNDIAKKCRDFLIQNPETCLYVDQDANNIILQGKVRYLSPTYNFQQQWFWPLSQREIHYSKWSEVDKYKNDPVIMHFCVHLKPWHKECSHPFRQEWVKYAKMYDFVGYKERSYWTPSYNFMSKVIGKLMTFRDKHCK